MSVLLITPFDHHGMEAFSRIAEIDETYVQSVGEDKIRRANTMLNSGSEFSLSCLELQLKISSEIVHKILGHPIQI